MGMAMEMVLGMGLHWEELLSSNIITVNKNYHNIFVKLIIFIANLVLFTFFYLKKYLFKSIIK